MENNLKLNFKKTLLMGSAFFSILLLWQVYNTYCPVFLDTLLKEKFGNDQSYDYIIGIIMAMDNLFALFMLPIFGHMSDKTKTKYGKRKPYIIIGMLVSAIIFPFIALFYFLNSAVSLVLVIILMGLTLVIMNIYRNPAVALMPDITPKPLRSKANGLINFIGYIGAIIGGVIAMFISTKETGVIVIVPFIISSVCILVAMVIFIFKVNEVKWLEESKKDMEIGEQLSQTIETVSDNKPLSKKDKQNLILILCSVFFWFMAFNAIETFLSLYCGNILEKPNLAGTLVIALTVSSLITFIPGSFLAMKIGRKLSIIIGIITVALGIALILTQQKADYNLIVLLIAFVLAGCGWALINISSFPMLVEMSNKNNIGKFTGLYYTSSMVAQTLTPIVVGIVMTLKQNQKPLFPYSLIMLSVALVIFIFVKEPKIKDKQKKSAFEAFDND